MRTARHSRPPRPASANSHLGRPNRLLSASVLSTDGDTLIHTCAPPLPPPKLAFRLGRPVDQPDRPPLRACKCQWSGRRVGGTISDKRQAGACVHAHEHVSLALCVSVSLCLCLRASAAGEVGRCVCVCVMGGDLPVVFGPAQCTASPS